MAYLSMIYVIVSSLMLQCRCQGLTLDGTSRKLFYTDEGSKVIGRMDMDSLESTVIVHTDMEQPRGIVADTSYKKLKRRYQNSYVEFAERCNRLYEL